MEATDVAAPRPRHAEPTRDAAHVRSALGGAHAVLEVLGDWGIEHLFICPGSTEAPLLDASLEHPWLHVVLTTHESIAVAMADAHARLTGRPAVACLHTHVGLQNGLAHLSCAHLERSPVLILNGVKATSLHGAGGFTTTSHLRDFARQYARWDWQVLDAASIARDLDRALKAATAQPQGPAYLAVPQDLLEHDGAIELPAAPEPAGLAVPDPQSVARAAELLAAAARPLIVAGAEIGRRAAATELLDVAERLGAPVYAEDRRTVESVDVPLEHPSFAGPLAADREAVARADLVLLAGARSPISFEHGDRPSVPAATPVVHLTADAGEAAKLHGPVLMLLGDARLGLTAIAAALRERAAAGGAERGWREHACAEWHEHLAAARAAAEADAGRLPIRVPALMHRLAGLLGPGDLLVDDSVTSSAALQTHLLAPGGPAYLTTAGGSLGWGMGAALGARLARPDRRVVAVIGDGVFQFGVQALATAVRERIAVTFVVVNNESYAAVKAALRRHGGQAAARGRFPATDLAGPRIADIAGGFGALGLRVERLEELAPAFEQAAAHAGPAVLEVITDRGDSGP